MAECVFCSIVKKTTAAQVIYKDQLIMSFMDTDPINTGHILIIPRRHVLDLDALSPEEAGSITAFAQVMVRLIRRKYHPDGYSIMQNGGVFNDIGHYHMHVFPRYRGDGFGWTFGTDTPCDLAQQGRELAAEIAASGLSSTW